MRFETDMGTIGISNDAIAAIASDVTRSCFGVKGMTSRSGLDGLVQLLRLDAQPSGVIVRPTSDGLIELDLHIAVNYGVNIPAICSSIVTSVQYNVEKLTGIKVSKVALFIDAIRN